MMIRISAFVIFLHFCKLSQNVLVWLKWNQGQHVTKYSMNYRENGYSVKDYGYFTKRHLICKGMGGWEKDSTVVRED